MAIVENAHLSCRNYQLACLHDQNKSCFFRRPTFSNQSELFEYFLNAGPPQKPLLFWSCKQTIKSYWNWQYASISINKPVWQQQHKATRG